MKGKVLLHPLPERLLHWLHALLMAVLMLSGYVILARKPFFLSFPTLMLLHKIAGILAAVNYVIWLLYEIRSRRIKGWIPAGEGFTSGLAAQLRWYLAGIFRGEKPPHIPTPENRLNPLQRLTYSTVMFLLVPLQGITGLALVAEIGGRALLLPLHIALFFLLLMFLMLHIYLSLSSPGLLLSMLKGTSGPGEEPED